MTYKFFTECSTLEEVKKLYRKLCFEHHPDRGGNTATMQSINNEYAFVCARMAKEGSKKDGSKRTAAEAEAEILSAEAYQEAINKIIHLEGINIELIGYWLWVTGETKQYAKILGSEPARFIYAGKKSDRSAWFFRTENFKTRNKKGMDLDDIRNKYGSEKINGKQGYKVNF